MAMFFSGCTSVPKQIGPKQTSRWAYSPNTMSVHPLSRIQTNGDSTSIVAHIAMLDGDGFACRGVGTLIVRIVAQNGTVLQEEVVNLQNPEINRELFDAVTRTYRLPNLHVPNDTKRAKLSATFNSVGDKGIRSKTSTLINHDNNE